MNKQTPLKRSTSTTLLLHSVFKTIQGEGPFSGSACVFVRLAGCNLQCPGCDTEYTEGATEVSQYNVLDQVVEAWGDGYPKLVVITGGEPFRQNLIPLIDCLQCAGVYVQIETNGSMRPALLTCEDELILAQAIIVCSPKTEKLNPNLVPYITHYKYVMRYDDIHSDGLPNWALNNRIKTHVARPPEDFEGDVYLQPMDMTEFYANDNKNALQVHNQLNTQACVKSCLENNYILQLQVHKLIGVE